MTRSKEVKGRLRFETRWRRRGKQRRQRRRAAKSTIVERESGVSERIIGSRKIEIDNEKEEVERKRDNQ